MKSALFFIALGVTLCTSLWAASAICLPMIIRAALDQSNAAKIQLIARSTAAFWLVMAGPLSLLFIILNHKK